MQRLTIIIIGLLLAAKCMANTHYVRPPETCTNTTAQSPYTSWADAATNIQWAVTAASEAGDTVLVSNGTYYLTDQVTIAIAITTTSVNGKEVTIVDGNNSVGKPITNRCFNLTGSGAVLDGFTITNGCLNIAGSGGGVSANQGTTVKNCRITGCVATNASANGAGIYCNGVITNCEIIGNINYDGSGAGIFTLGATIANCTIASNRCLTSGEIHGVGIYVYSYFAVATLISNCKIYGNTGSSTSYGGGVGIEPNADYEKPNPVIRNSLIYDNSAGSGGGIYSVNTAATIQNCTVVSNRATDQAGGIGGSIPANKTNCIENTVCYFNTGTYGSNFFNWMNGAYTGSWQIVSSCIAPTNAFSTSGISGYYYANNIEVNPQFAGKDTGNWRLTRGSLGVNAGTNQTWMDGAFDLDGRTRKDRFSGIVDMGCYEYLPQGAIFSVR